MTRNNQQPHQMALHLAARRHNLTVDRYKRRIAEQWSKPQDEHVLGAEGLGFKVYTCNGGMDWQIDFSDGESNTLTRIIRLVDPLSVACGESVEVTFEEFGTVCESDFAAVLVTTAGATPRVAGELERRLYQPQSGKRWPFNPSGWLTAGYEVTLNLPSMGQISEEFLVAGLERDGMSLQVGHYRNEHSALQAARAWATEQIRLEGQEWVAA